MGNDVDHESYERDLTALGLSSRIEEIRSGGSGLHLGMKVTLRRGYVSCGLAHDRLIRRWSAKYEVPAIWKGLGEYGILCRMNYLLKSNIRICATTPEQVIKVLRSYFLRLTWSLLLSGLRGEERARSKRRILRDSHLSKDGHLRVCSIEELKGMVRELRLRHRSVKNWVKKEWCSFCLLLFDVVRLKGMSHLLC